MGRDLDSIRRRFGPDDLAPLLQRFEIARTVLVQTVAGVAETREFLATASTCDFIGGVVGWVALTDGRVRDVIDELRSGPGGNKLVGVCHQVHDEADEEWLLRGDVQRSIAEVGKSGLAFDLLVRVRELPAAIETARRHQDVRFVLDHAALPRIASGRRDSDWEYLVEPLAELPNVTCKLSGLVIGADWEKWTPAQLEPYVDRVMEWFGPSRCMFGSEWPVCLLAATYDQVFDAMRSIVGENDEVFGGTAARVYGIAAAG